MASDLSTTPRPPGKKARTRAKILDAAGSMFAEGGVQATTIEDIAEASGVAVGTIYQHFGSKQMLALAFVSDAFTVAEQYVAEAQLAETAFERVLAAGDAYYRFAMEQPDACRFALIRVFQSERTPDDAVLDQGIRERVGALVLSIAGDVKQAMRDGDLPTEPIDETMVFLWGAWNGVVHLVLRRDQMAIPAELGARSLETGRRMMGHTQRAALAARTGTPPPPRN